MLPEKENNNDTERQVMLQDPCLDWHRQEAEHACRVTRSHKLTLSWHHSPPRPHTHIQTHSTSLPPTPAQGHTPQRPFYSEAHGRLLEETRWLTRGTRLRIPPRSQSELGRVLPPCFRKAKPEAPAKLPCTHFSHFQFPWINIPSCPDCCGLSCWSFIVIYSSVLRASQLWGGGLFTLTWLWLDSQILDETED